MRAPASPSPVTGAATLPWWDRSSSWLAAAVFLLALVVYAPVFGADFNWDDAGHLTRADLRGLGGLFRIWFEPGATQQYYPLLHSAFWLEYHLWGDAPLGYHLINVLLHATSACLFAALLRRLAVPGAWLAAILFVVHPVCVESVAWIAEQKNTLSLVLYLCAALAYLRFDAGRRPSQYATASLLFVAALATKTVTASLPAALLVVFWWRRGRLDLRRDVLPVLPWFVLAAIAGFVTAWVERTMIGASGSSFELDVVQRVLLAGRVVWFYLLKLLWPANLMFIYPRWTIDASVAWQYLFPLAAVALPVTFILMRQRGLLAAFLLYSGSLFPALGFVNVYPFIFSFVADHFQYLASLSILATVGVGFARALQRSALWAYVGGGAGLIVLALLTASHSAIFRDSITLWEATVRQNPDSWMVRNNLAEALAAEGRHEEAIPHLERALKLKPDLAEAENNLGDDLRILGRINEAIPHLERALQLQPRFAEAHNNLGAALMVAGRTEEGIQHFRDAIRLRPEFALAHRNLGLALASHDRVHEAIPHFTAAVKADPTYSAPELDWAIALTLMNRFSEAVPHFERALKLAPRDFRVHLAYGRALARQGRHEDAISRFREAVGLAPDSAEVHHNLALSYQQLGHRSEAAAAFAEAQRLGGGPR